MIRLICLAGAFITLVLATHAYDTGNTNDLIFYGLSFLFCNGEYNYWSSK